MESTEEISPWSHCTHLYRVKAWWEYEASTGLSVLMQWSPLFLYIVYSSKIATLLHVLGHKQVSLIYLVINFSIIINHPFASLKGSTFHNASKYSYVNCHNLIRLCALKLIVICWNNIIRTLYYGKVAHSQKFNKKTSFVQLFNR